MKDTTIPLHDKIPEGAIPLTKSRMKAHLPLDRMDWINFEHSSDEVYRQFHPPEKETKHSRAKSTKEN